MKNTSVHYSTTEGETRLSRCDTMPTSTLLTSVMFFKCCHKIAAEQSLNDLRTGELVLVEAVDPCLINLQIH